MQLKINRKHRVSYLVNFQKIFLYSIKTFSFQIKAFNINGSILWLSTQSYQMFICISICYQGYKTHNFFDQNSNLYKKIFNALHRLWAFLRTTNMNACFKASYWHWTFYIPPLHPNKKICGWSFFNLFHYMNEFLSDQTVLPVKRKSNLLSFSLSYQNSWLNFFQLLRHEFWISGRLNVLIFFVVLRMKNWISNLYFQRLTNIHNKVCTISCICCNLLCNIKLTRY